MVRTLIELNDSAAVRTLIATCKSDSKIVGVNLRNAHYNLGREIVNAYGGEFHNPVAVCFMRGGLPFSMGVADALDCPILFYDDKACPDFFNLERAKLEGREVLLIDSVVNSGKGMLKAVESLKGIASGVKVLTNVMCYTAVEKFSDCDAFTVRVSGNSFKGSNVRVQCGNKGPDTGDRLFRIGLNS